MNREEKCLIKFGKKIRFIDKEKIILIEACSSFSKLILQDRELLVRTSLKELLEKLNSDSFIRVNRSTIINLNQVVELEELESRDYLVRLNNDKRIKWGRRYKDNFPKLTRL